MDTKMVAKRLAQESIVLLENKDQVLPLAKGQKVAFFGNEQVSTYFSGNGSGAARTDESTEILTECERAGLVAVPALKAFYQEKPEGEAPVQELPEGIDIQTYLSNLVHSGAIYEMFGKYRAPEEEKEVPDALLEESAACTDTALLIIGRNSGGEECDRHLTEDYYLTVSEKKLAEQVCKAFPKVIVVLNTNGLIDLKWLSDYESIKSVLFLGIPGEQGAAALSELLAGEVSPSGKLAVTIATDYEDYPASEYFTWNKDVPEDVLTYETYGLDAAENGSTGFEKSPVTLYKEGIYAGYRYFDTFGRKPLYPFGHGLSYTTFAIENAKAERQKGGFYVSAQVTNTGEYVGKEVVQLYLCAQGTKTERAKQELKGFVKTGWLKPGEQETVEMFVPFRELACYEEETAAYVIEAGQYVLRVGNSSADTEAVKVIAVQEDIVAEQCSNRLGLKACNVGKLEFLSAAGERSEAAPEECVLTLTAADVAADLSVPVQEMTCEEQPGADNVDLSTFTDTELATLCVGYGPGTPFAGMLGNEDPETFFYENGEPITTNSHPTGHNGYVSPAMTARGIESVFYKDGPAGVGHVAWPTEMLIACSFDRELWYAFGNAVGEECVQDQVQVWLAPAANMHRNPLGGRNFEYISEDPYLTGICGCEIAKGVQENHPVIVCPKHFAVNEQETFRRGSSKKNYDAVDSILSERAAREIYLKPFEMMVKEADVHCIMTSFNKINGTFAGGSDDLCTHILREEWGFRGAVVTDWGDMDVVVDGADAVAAGNDIVMPGGPPVIGQILKGLEQGRVTRAQMEKAVSNLLDMLQAIREKQSTDL